MLKLSAPDGRCTGVCHLQCLSVCSQHFKTKSDFFFFTEAEWAPAFLLLCSILPPPFSASLIPSYEWVTVWLFSPPARSGFCHTHPSQQTEMNTCTGRWAFISIVSEYEAALGKQSILGLQESIRSGSEVWLSNFLWFILSGSLFPQWWDEWQWGPKWNLWKGTIP